MMRAFILHEIEKRRLREEQRKAEESYADVDEKYDVSSYDYTNLHFISVLYKNNYKSKL